MPENKILLLSKCVERRFAEKLFYDGVLHFGYPSEWIKKAEEGNTEVRRFGFKERRINGKR